MTTAAGGHGRVADHATKETPMAHQPPYPNLDKDTGEGLDRGPGSRISRWQKVVGIIGLLVALAIGFLLFGPGLGGDHSPGGATPGGNQEQQTDPGESGEHTPPPWVPEGGHG
jgi:hypothetical protein